MNAYLQIFPRRYVHQRYRITLRRHSIPNIRHKLVFPVQRYVIFDGRWEFPIVAGHYKNRGQYQRFVTIFRSKGISKLSYNYALLLADLRSTIFVENGRYDVISSETVLLKWESPQSSNRCVHHFVVSFSNVSGLQMLVTNNTEMLVSGLNACSQYRFTIGARTMFQEIIGKSFNIIVKTSAFGESTYEIQKNGDNAVNCSRIPVVGP